jgi:hypothetical protein
MNINNDLLFEVGNLLPNSKLAIELKQSSDRKMLKSLKYLISVVHKALPENNFDDIIANIDSKLNSEWKNFDRVPATLHIVHSKLRSAVEDHQVKEALANINALRSYEILTDKIQIGPLGGDQWSWEENQNIKDILDQSSLKTYGVTMGVSEPSSILAIQMNDAISSALKILKEVDKELYTEIYVFVTDIVYYDSTKTTSSSSFNCLGLINMNCIRGLQNWTTVLEMIVHEAAHQFVFNMMMHNQLILNEGEGLYKSSLRKDPRPMSGIYHATIVIARIIYIMSKLSNSVLFHQLDIKIVQPKNNARNESPYSQKFLQVEQVIRENGKLSELGSHMLNSASILAKMPIKTSYVHN